MLITQVCLIAARRCTQIVCSVLGVLGGGQVIGRYGSICSPFPRIAPDLGRKAPQPSPSAGLAMYSL
jgi:hypothetical protein